jgi:hypothetical protein
MLLVAERRDKEAVEELRGAIHSPTNGFTRVNYELGKALLRLDRPAEAVPIARAAAARRHRWVEPVPHAHRRA